MVADRDVLDTGADLLDDSGALVAEDVGEHLGGQERAHGDVGVAQAGGHDPHEHLALAGVVELYLDQLEVLARRLDQRHRRLHASNLGPAGTM